jgi:hypothetical protein
MFRDQHWVRGYGRAYALPAKYLRNRATLNCGVSFGSYITIKDTGNATFKALLGIRRGAAKHSGAQRHQAGISSIAPPR